MISRLSFLSRYEIYPTYEIGEVGKAEMQEGYLDPMHGPIQFLGDY